MGDLEEEETRSRGRGEEGRAWKSAFDGLRRSGRWTRRRVVVVVDSKTNTHDLSRGSVDEVDLVALSDGVRGEVGSTIEPFAESQRAESSMGTRERAEEALSSPDGRDGDGGRGSFLLSDEGDGRSQERLVLVDQEDFPRGGVGGNGALVRKERKEEEKGEER